MNPILKNLSLSVIFFVGSSKVVKLLSNRISNKFLTNYCIPTGHIIGLYTSRYYLGMVELSSLWGSIPLSLLNFALNSYMYSQSISIWMSVITLIVGYPTVVLLYNFVINKIKQTKLTELMNEYKIMEKYEELEVIAATIYEKLCKNKNWDIVWNGVSFKTFSKPKKMIGTEELNEKVPLKCKSMNPTTSKYLGNECSICLNEINVNGLHRELSCGHVFHPNCVDSWLLECDATCPICRKCVYDN